MLDPTPSTLRSECPPGVVFLIDDLHNWGGTETHLFRLLARLDLARIRPVVVVLGRAGLAGSFRRQGIPVFALKAEAASLRSIWERLRRTRSILSRERGRLLVSYHTGADLIAPVLSLVSGVPAVSCRRDDGFMKKPIHVRLQRRLNPFLAGMISVSDAVARTVERTENFPRRRNMVIWNGEDLERFRPGASAVRTELGLEAEARVIACVARFDPVKDHKTLLDAFARVIPLHPEARLLLVGSGPLREALRERANHLGKHVIFLGHRDDVPEILRGCHLYAQTSRTEGFSNAILQAMATALPVVATRVGGNAELLTEECGFLVAPGDSGAVAERLGRLLANAGLRDAMGAAARRRVEERCSLAVMTESYTTAFERAIRGAFQEIEAGSKVTG